MIEHCLRHESRLYLSLQAPLDRLKPKCCLLNAMAMCHKLPTCLLLQVTLQLQAVILFMCIHTLVLPVFAPGLCALREPPWMAISHSTSRSIHITVQNYQNCLERICRPVFGPAAVMEVNSDASFSFQSCLTGRRPSRDNVQCRVLHCLAAGCPFSALCLSAKERCGARSHLSVCCGARSHLSVCCRHRVKHCCLQDMKQQFCF